MAPTSYPLSGVKIETGSFGVRANTDGTSEARSAHVPVFPHAQEGLARGGVIHGPVLLGGPEGGCEAVWPLDDDEFRAWFGYECQAVAQAEDPDPWTEAVSAELVACTLGQRRHADRTELRVDLKGRILQAARGLRNLF